MAYWAFVTLTSIGYGDITPTPEERMYVAIWMVYGLAVMSSLLGVAAEFFLKKQELKLDIIRKRVSSHPLVGRSLSWEQESRAWWVKGEIPKLDLL